VKVVVMVVVVAVAAAVANMGTVMHVGQQYL